MITKTVFRMMIDDQPTSFIQIDRGGFFVMEEDVNHTYSTGPDPTMATIWLKVTVARAQKLFDPIYTVSPVPARPVRRVWLKREILTPSDPT